MRLRSSGRDRAKTPRRLSSSATKPPAASRKDQPAAIVVLSAMLGKAVEWNYLTINPAAKLKRPHDERQPGEHMHPLDAAGVRTLVDAAEGQLARTLLFTAALTGMRRGEVLGVQWGDIDWTRNRIWVRQSIGLRGVKRPKTRKSVRAIALTPTLTFELEAHWKESPFKGAADYVFASERGTPLDGRNMVRNVFEPAVRRAKLPRMRFHDLRHTFASLLIAQDAHVKYISEQLGHASVQITLDRYGHLFDQSYTDESAKLEKALADTLAPASTASALQADLVQTGAGAFHSNGSAST